MNEPVLACGMISTNFSHSKSEVQAKGVGMWGRCAPPNNSTSDLLRLIQTAAANYEFFFANYDFFYFSADGCVRRVRFPQTTAFSAANCGRLNEPLNVFNIRFFLMG